MLKQATVAIHNLILWLIGSLSRTTKRDGENGNLCPPHSPSGVSTLDTESESDGMESAVPDTLEPSEVPGKRDEAGTAAPTKRNGQRPAIKPELLCRKSQRLRSWKIILSVPEECEIKEVRHNSVILHSASNNEYELSSFSGTLSVQYITGGKEDFPLFNNNAPIIFKLLNNWKGDGRAMRNITKGYFIAFAPRTWTQTGHISVVPEDCVDNDFLAHYFSRKSDDTENSAGGFEEYQFTPSKAMFELCGDHAMDDSEDGELYVGTPPDLKVESEVVWARVGEEKRNGWAGENFMPADTPLRDVLDGRQGRFFIRVYDDAGKLADSGQFRYCADLQDIRINGETYSQTLLLNPSADSHSKVSIQFVGIDGAAGRTTLDIKHPNTALKEGDTVIVEPHPRNDHVVCALISKKGCVNVEIRLPRIWWGIGQSDSKPKTWHDTSLSMTRGEFRIRADEDDAIWLRLPERIKFVRAGFDGDWNQKIRIAQGSPLILLERFADNVKIDDPLQEDAMLEIQCEDVVFAPIRVVADPQRQPDKTPPRLKSPSPHEHESITSMPRYKGRQHYYKHIKCNNDRIIDVNVKFVDNNKDPIMREFGTVKSTPHKWEMSVQVCNTQTGKKRTTTYGLPCMEDDTIDYVLKKVADYYLIKVTQDIATSELITSVQWRKGHTKNEETNGQ